MWCPKLRSTPSPNESATLNLSASRPQIFRLPMIAGGCHRSTLMSTMKWIKNFQHRVSNPFLQEQGRPHVGEASRTCCRSQCSCYGPCPENSFSPWRIGPHPSQNSALHPSHSVFPQIWPLADFPACESHAHSPSVGPLLSRSQQCLPHIHSSVLFRTPVQGRIHSWRTSASQEQDFLGAAPDVQYMHLRAQELSRWLRSCGMFVQLQAILLNRSLLCSNDAITTRKLDLTFLSNMDRCSIAS